MTSRIETKEPAATAGAATPRPWRQISVSDQNDRWTITQAGVDHPYEASLFVGGRVRNEADAELIVAAVNDHERLRRIEDAARAFVRSGGWDTFTNDSDQAAMDLRAALTSSTPEKP